MPVEPTTFPWCQLHQCQIVTALPAKCPLGTAKPIEAIIQIRDAAWQQLGSQNSELYIRGNANLHRQAVCHECIRRLRGHPWIQHLRANIDISTPPVPVPVSEGDTVRRVPVAKRRASVVA